MTENIIIVIGGALFGVVFVYIMFKYCLGAFLIDVREFLFLKKAGCHCNTDIPIVCHCHDYGQQNSWLQFIQNIRDVI